MIQKTKNIAFGAVFFALALPACLSGQEVRAEGEPAGVIRGLDREADKIAALAGRRLASLGGGKVPSVRAGVFELRGQETPLGALWRLNLAGSMSRLPDKKFILISETAGVRADYEITGEIADIVNSVRIYTRLVDGGNGGILDTWYTDMEKSLFVEELIYLSEGASGPVFRDRYEPDSREQPVNADIDGGWIIRTLHTGDADWFLLSPGRDGFIRLETSGDTDTLMELYERNSGSVLMTDDDSGEGGNAKIEFQAGTGKEYTVMVQGYSGATGRYRFQALNFELPDRNLEPNDIREQASPVNLGTPAEAYLMSSEDADWYRISISGNGRFTVYTEGGTDTLLSLYDGNGNLLAEDDDSGAGGNARISRNISGGTFFIKVMPYGGDDGGSSGPYTLRTALNGTPALDGFEPDDRVDQAGDIAVGDSQTRTFTDGDDIDWARLRVTRPGRYVIRAGGEKKNELDTYIELFDAANSLVAQDDDGGGNYDSLLNVELQSGTYYIKVSTLDDEPEDRYILSVEAE